MNDQHHLDYNRIAEAIEFIKTNFKRQPTLDEIARQVHLSPFHFHRLFSEWAGTTPKKFLQFISVEHAKTLLQQNKSTLFDAAFETGLSGTGRLHDLFINIEGMTPAEYKYGGKSLDINYSFADTLFGDIIVASTTKGICYLTFSNSKEEGYIELKEKFPNAKFQHETDLLQQKALAFFQHDWNRLSEIKLHLRGTDFQIKVWESLLKIPFGQLSTYGNIAATIDKPGASRAVGTATGSNPVAYLIPCHRVIKSTGSIGDYMWGNTRKTAIIGWEIARAEQF